MSNEFGFKKSSYSGINGCVEVKLAGASAAVRDSKGRSAAVLTFGAQDWSVLIASIKNGDFDL